MAQQDENMVVNPETNEDKDMNAPPKIENNGNNFNTKDIEEVKLVNPIIQTIVVNDEDDSTPPRTIRIEHTADGTVKVIETIKIPTICGSPISIIPTGWAICLLIINMILPGIGTSFIIHIWQCGRKKDCCKTHKNVIAQCKWWGIAILQLLLTPFIIGYVWSIYTGVIVIKYSRYYGHEVVVKADQNAVIKIVKEVATDPKRNENENVEIYDSDRKDKQLLTHNQE